MRYLIPSLALFLPLALGQAQAASIGEPLVPAGSTDLILVQSETESSDAETAPKADPNREFAAVEAWVHPDGELVLGEADAPVTVIEYISLTCPSCAAFHARSYDYLIENYVDKGKVKLVLREFPLDQIALAGAMLVRCAPEEQRANIISLILKKQQAWRSGKNAFGSLVKFLGQAGYTKERVKECLAKKDLQKAIAASRKAGSDEFGVKATPTFYFNGEHATGALTPKQLDEKLKPLLGEPLEQ